MIINIEKQRMSACVREKAQCLVFGVLLVTNISFKFDLFYNFDLFWIIIFGIFINHINANFI